MQITDAQSVARPSPSPAPRSAVTRNVDRLLDGRSRAWLAQRIGRTPMYVSRRMRDEVPWSTADLEHLAATLATTVADLVDPASTSTPGPRALWIDAAAASA